MDDYYDNKPYEMDLAEYVKLYDKLMMNLVMVQNEDIEYFDEINDFLNDAAYDADIELYEGRNKRRTLIRFFKINNDIGYHGNIFLDKSGTEIYYQLQELYEEVLNEFADEE